MELFDFCLYVAAITLVLILRAETTPATEAPTAPQPIIEARPETTPAPAMAQAITEPVVSVTIRTEATEPTEAPAELASLKTPQLRKLCTAAGIRWRNAHGKKHLRNAEMIEALLAS